MGGLCSAKPQDNLTANATNEVTDVTDFAIYVACTRQQSSETAAIDTEFPSWLPRLPRKPDDDATQHYVVNSPFRVQL